MKIKFVRSFVQSDMLRIIIELFNFTLLLLVIFLYYSKLSIILRILFKINK